MKRGDYNVTATGGRQATTRHIAPKLALAVGKPSAPAPRGWQWTLLTDLARLESGHTPSRRHPEYWGGNIPWISIGDARANDGRMIDDTEEKTNEIGIANSSARILPKNTVCLSRTASVGYVVVMGRPMATSQDFVNWVCGDQLDHNFLKYLLVAEDDDLLRFASGSVHQTIYFPEVKAFYVCHPDPSEQTRIVSAIDEGLTEIGAAKVATEKCLQNARAIFESHLQSVFTRRRPGWKQTTLGDEIELLAGFAFKSAKYTTKENDIRLLRGDNIIPGCLRWDDVKRWPINDSEEYERYWLREGDVVLAMDRPWVKAGLKHATIANDDLPCLLVQRTARLRGGANLDNRFLKLLIGSSAFSSHVLGVQTGIGVPHISGQQIKDFAFLRPPMAEQRVIADNLGSVQEETQRLASTFERKLAALECLKKSLLHQAFSGQL